MKNLLKLTIVFLLIFSCSENEPFEEPFIPDPTVIAEYHVLNSNEEVRLKYIFDDFGRMQKYQNLVSDIFIEFEFDTSDKLISISTTDIDGILLETPLNISYDANDRVTNIGDRIFSLNETENKYYEDSSFFERSYWEEGDIGYQTYSYRYYEVNINNTISRCYSQSGDRDINIITNEILYEYEYTDWGWGIHYVNSNIVTNRSFTGSSSVTLEYDTLTNPLYFENSNLNNVCIFFQPASLNIDLNRDILQAMTPALSVNNKILWKDSSPENIRYFFEFNDLELPTQSTYQYYYGETLESEFVYSKYYYQGDDIPE